MTCILGNMHANDKSNAQGCKLVLSRSRAGLTDTKTP